MIIKNMDFSKDGLDVDLSYYFDVQFGRYIIYQIIYNSQAHYRIWDNLKQKEVVPYSDGKVRLIDKAGNAIRPTIKNIVRAVYNSEYCRDSIPDLSRILPRQNTTLH